jgi:hypothetical protein
MTLYSEFARLIPVQAVYVGTVASVASGIATITVPGGQPLRARTAGLSVTPGNTVLVQGDAVLAVLPARTSITIDV